MARMQFSESFPAMGTTVDVLIETDSPPIAAFLSIRLLFERQEAVFSRFRDASLLSRLNAGEMINDARFAAACSLALEANAFTQGIFNPMVLTALREAGYDRTFEDITSQGSPRAQSVPRLADCLGVSGSRVRLREGQLDLGGIVKGWTVDLALDMFCGEFDGLLVNAGGDLRCAGNEDGNDGWWVEVDGPGSPAWSGLVRGAVATSSTAKRRWKGERGTLVHHLIDPRTGLPADSGFAQVTVWGAETWRAECWAKAILIAGKHLIAEAASAGYTALCTPGG